MTILIFLTKVVTGGEAIFSLLLFAHISIIEIIIKNASKARLQNVYTES